MLIFEKLEKAMKYIDDNLAGNIGNCVYQHMRQHVGINICSFVFCLSYVHQS